MHLKFIPSIILFLQVQYPVSHQKKPPKTNKTKQKNYEKAVKND